METDLTNAEIADTLEELGDLYELDGADRYRVAAYRRAAATIRSWPRSVAQAVREGTVEELPGIGTTLKAKLTALLQSGEIPQATALKERYPPGLRELLGVPGVGARRARDLYDQLGIASLAELEAAAREGRVSALKGFGKAFERQLLERRPQVAEAGERQLLLPQALALAAELQTELGVELEPVGEARRQTEQVATLELLAVAGEQLLGRFCEIAQVEAVELRTPAEAAIRTHSGARVRLRTCSREALGSALVAQTGSPTHVARLVELGLRETPAGLAAVGPTGTLQLFNSEADLYAHLGLPPIPVELREDRGELEAAREGRLPQLVCVEDLQGDLHCHTVASDGRSTIEELAAAARARGYRYIAITDHSASHGFGRAVSVAALEEQIGRVRELRGRTEVEVLIGSEVNILPDGSLDYPDELLAQLDWVVASVHTAFNQDQGTLTARILRALDHPYVDALGHPSGRLIGRRPPYRVDLEAVIAKAVETSTFLEINANPLRRDLDERHVRLAVQAGGMVVIDSDAHAANHLDFIRYGVATARRGWVGKGQVANALPWPELKRLRKRERVGR